MIRKPCLVKFSGCIKFYRKDVFKNLGVFRSGATRDIQHSYLHVNENSGGVNTFIRKLSCDKNIRKVLLCLILGAVALLNALKNSL